MINLNIIRVFCPRAGPSLQTQEPRPQFCSKASLPPQTQEPRLQFQKGWIGAVAFCCFPHPTLSLASEQILKDLKHPRCTSVEVRRVNLAHWVLWTSPKFTTGVKHLFHQYIFFYNSCKDFIILVINFFFILFSHSYIL